MQWRPWSRFGMEGKEFTLLERHWIIFNKWALLMMAAAEKSLVLLMTMLHFIIPWVNFKHITPLHLIIIMYLHIYFYTYLHTYTYIHIYTHIHTYIYIFTCIHTHIHTHIQTHTYVYVLYLINRVKFIQTLFKLFFRFNVFLEKCYLIPNSRWSKNLWMLEVTTPTMR